MHSIGPVDQAQPIALLSNPVDPAMNPTPCSPMLPMPSTATTSRMATLTSPATLVALQRSLQEIRVKAFFYVPTSLILLAQGF